MEKRGALASVEEGVKALTSIGKLNVENEKALILGVDPRTFMNFNLTVPEALGVTSEIMIKLLVCVIIYALCMYGFIHVIRSNIVGVDDLTEKSRATISILTLWACVGWVSFWSSFTFLHGVLRPFVYIRHVVVFLFVYFSIHAYFEFFRRPP